MEFDRPVFQYPPIGADGAPVPSVSLADFNRLYEDAQYWRQICRKEKDRILATNCLDKKPNVTCSKALEALRIFYRDMLACQIEERRRRSADQLKCQPTNEKSKMDTIDSQTQLPGLISPASAQQNHFRSLRQRVINSSAIYNHHLQIVDDIVCFDFLYYFRINRAIC
jgi:hypothetical protein